MKTVFMQSNNSAIPTVGVTVPPSVAVTGTAASGWYESEVVSGGQTIVLTVTNGAWVAAGSTFDAQRQNILDGITSAQGETNGWNAKRSGLSVTDVVRTSATVVTITLDALATYSVTANETLTITVPSGALTAGVSAIATPTLTIIEGAPSSGVTAYYNSTEAGGDGSDLNVLLADDFNRGWWYRKDADHNGAGNGFSDAAQGTEAGWSGTIFYGVDGSGNVGDGGAIAADSAIFSSYAAYMGNHTGSIGGTYMAEHNLAGGGATEIWLRYYHKFSSGYTFGAEKTIGTLNRQNGGGIYFGNVHINIGGGPSSTGALQFQPVGGGESNQSTGFTFSGNLHWYCVIVHAKLGSGNFTGDGTLEIWADDCGLDGVSGPSSPTLRLSRTDYHWPNVSGDKFGSIWFESWANPGSTGQSWFKNVMVRSDHSPGFRTA